MWVPTHLYDGDSDGGLEHWLVTALPDTPVMQQHNLAFGFSIFILICGITRKFHSMLGSLSPITPGRICSFIVWESPVYCPQYWLLFIFPCDQYYDLAFISMTCSIFLFLLLSVVTRGLLSLLSLKKKKLHFGWLIWFLPLISHL